MLRETCKKNNFKLGVNFDFDLLRDIIEMNNKSNENKITELYGSDATHSDLAARPKFRLPDITSKELKEYVKIAKENGIDFNYTMNSFFPYMSKEELKKNIDTIVDFICCFILCSDRIVFF